jgi:nucleotide-binding universal stress UspA family protein
MSPPTVAFTLRPGALPPVAISHDVSVYENVIVPFEGSLAGRVVLSPASDLAWRQGARMVVVTNTDASDKSSKAAVKLQAIAKSGADVEFWVDLEHPLADASLKAVAYRKDPMLCVATPRASSTLRRRRKALGQLVTDTVARATVPVLVVGPSADVSRGLAMTELVVVLDCTPSAEGLLDFAVEWCEGFKLRLIATAAPASGTGFTRPDLQQYLDQRVDRVKAPGGVAAELIDEGDEADEVVALLDRHPDAIVLVSANHGKAGGLGGFATKLATTSPRPVLVHAG